MSNIVRSQSGNLPIGAAKLRSIQETQARYLLIDQHASDIETEIVVSTPKTGFFGFVHYRVEERVTIRTRKSVQNLDTNWWS